MTKKNVQIVAINDLTDTKTLAHLLKYDSVYGRYHKNISHDNKGIKVDKRFFPVYAIPDPKKLPWKKLKVDIVLECTGRFTKAEDAKKHLKAGAKKVILSAPAKSEGIQTLVLGTESLKKNIKKNNLISNASCTTNCTSPVMQVLDSNFNIEKAFLSTIHGYTATQNIQDGPHKDLRRARAAAHNIVPTTTGAAIATSKAIPKLENIFDGIAIRVPVIDGSLIDITALIKKNTSAEEVNRAFIKAAKNPLYKGILTVTNESIVSTDIIGSPYSAIVDLQFTKVIGNNLVKVIAWYDNEFGYSNRLIELAIKVGKQ